VPANEKLIYALYGDLIGCWIRIKPRNCFKEYEFVKSCFLRFFSIPLYQKILFYTAVARDLKKYENFFCVWTTILIDDSNKAVIQMETVSKLSLNQPIMSCGDLIG